MKPSRWIPTGPIFALLLAGCGGAVAPEGAHVHGVARLNVALDDARGGTVELIAPAESLYGFEHAATSDADRATQEAALATLRDEIGRLLVLDPALGCRFEAQEVDVVYEDHAHEDGEADAEHADGEESISGTHSEVHAAWALACDADLTDTTARAAFGDAFPGIEELVVTVLSDAGQTSLELAGGNGELDL